MNIVNVLSLERFYEFASDIIVNIKKKSITVHSKTVLLSFCLSADVREVMFSSTTQLSQGLSATEYTAIGLSSVILALIYVASVSLYLHSKKTRRKIVEEPEISLTPGREVSGLVKNNPLLAASRHFESDTNSGLTESDLGDDLQPSDGEQGFENVGEATFKVFYLKIVREKHRKHIS